MQPVMDDPQIPQDADAPPGQMPPQRPSARFMLAHPAHLIALGGGSGLSPAAPGTAGTLWGWLAYLVLSQWLSPHQMGQLIGGALLVGWWACTTTARDLGVKDPSSVVWDEVVAFWLVLWLIMPANLVAQTIAFALFRLFDAAKPGPVGWADRLFHDVDTQSDPYGWHKAGFGILLDDLVAAFCVLLLFALWRLLP
jgi:phosphatidylglycerophosphatase A